MKEFSLDKVPNIEGKTAIVTGANIGLGYETTKALAENGIKVIMACRNIEKAEKAKDSILEAVPNASLSIIPLDLSDQASVRNFTKLYLTEYDRLDILINNAGIFAPPYTKTVDGLESQIAVNYFSHFLLAILLFPTLDQTEGSRIIHMSSITHKKASINLKDINSEKKYSKFKAYGQSKLASLLFGYELQRRIDRSNSQVLSIIVHPGVSLTNIGHHIPKWIYNLGSPLVSLFSHAPDKAALSIVYAALDSQVKGGEFYGPTGFNEMTGNPGKAFSSKVSHDLDLAKKLWSLSEKLVGQKFNI